MNPLLWHEPAQYGRAKYSQMEALTPLRSVKFALFTFFCILGCRWLGGLHPAPDAHPPGWSVSTAMALGIALFLAYVLPRFIGFFPNSIVILSEKGVNNNTVGRGVRVRFWPWSEIAFCYAWTEALNNEQYPVLSFCDARGSVLTTLACSKKIPLSEIARVLHTYGIPLQYEQPIPSKKPHVS